MIKKLILLASLQLLITLAALSQKSKETLVSSEEVKDDSVKKTSYFEKTFQNLVANDIDEKGLIKLDLIPYFNKGVAAGYERRVGKGPFSVFAYSEFYLTQSNGRVKMLQTLNYGRHYSFNLDGIFDLGGRYYYNKNRRIRKGKNANSFSANYIGIVARGTFSTKEWNGRVGADNQNASLMSALTAGMQRRLGKIGFVEWNNEIGYGRFWIYETKYLGPNSLSISPKDHDAPYFRSSLRVGLAF